MHFDTLTSIRTKRMTLAKEIYRLKETKSTKYKTENHQNPRVENSQQHL